MTTTPARILVVDDEESILQFVSYNLRKEGYEVTVAPDGDTALALVADSPFDLIVLDMRLPGRDGLQVLKNLRARGFGGQPGLLQVLELAGAGQQARTVGLAGDDEGVAGRAVRGHRGIIAQSRVAFRCTVGLC